MPHLSAEAKHHILLEYAPHSATHSLAALAARHAVKGGKRVLLRWHQQWDGTAASLTPFALSIDREIRIVAGAMYESNPGQKSRPLRTSSWI
jgi:hypothetical protein